MGALCTIYSREKKLTEELLNTFNKYSPEIKAGDLEVKIYNRGDRAQFSIKDDEGKIISQFTFDNLPQNGSIVMSTQTYVYKKCRNKGVGQAMQRVKEVACRVLGIPIMLCTISTNNEVQQHILNKFGWNELLNFINEYGSNNSMYVKQVTL